MSLYFIEGVSHDEFLELQRKIQPPGDVGFVYSAIQNSIDVYVKRRLSASDREGKRVETEEMLMPYDWEDLEPDEHAAAYALYWKIRRELKAIRNV